jgi:dTDP-4-dehydrorhamnose reductase
VKILLTGPTGQVGWELAPQLSRLGEVIAPDRQALDLADADAIGALVRELRPDVIVNAAAYTAVDRAESEPDLALAINGTAPGVLADEAKRLGALLVHYSTDYVFDGAKVEPYTEDDTPNPLSVYGRSKLDGERAIQASGCRHLILRTSWVYATRGRNFLLTMLRLGAERPELRVVGDQRGAPTWARDIAGRDRAAARQPAPRVVPPYRRGGDDLVRLRVRDHAPCGSLAGDPPHPLRRVPDRRAAAGELGARQRPHPCRGRSRHAAVGGQSGEMSGGDTAGGNVSARGVAGRTRARTEAKVGSLA